MSTWNLPPGCSANDLPGNRSEDLLEDEYIKLNGECGVRTISDCWLDLCPARIDKVQRGELQSVIEAALAAHLTELEIAEWSAAIVGNPDFETWVGDQEDE